MDDEINGTLFIEAPQVRQHGGLHRFWHWPAVLPMAETALDIGHSLAPCPAPKSTVTRSDPVFQSFSLIVSPVIAA